MNSAERWENFDAPFETLRQAVEESAFEMGCRELSWSNQNQTLTAVTPLKWKNILTRGEKLTVAVDPSGEIWVQSESRAWNAKYGYHFDFGIHNDNCRRLLELVRNKLTLKKMEPSA